MARVVGIGGVFMKAKDPAALAAWYRRHLGIEVAPWGGFVFRWGREDGPGTAGMTVWCLMPADTTYFAPSEAAHMVNYIVRDLDQVLADLRAEGCTVDERTERSEFGTFGWVMDPEGNRLELWQPPETPPAGAQA